MHMNPRFLQRAQVRQAITRDRARKAAWHAANRALVSLRCAARYAANSEKVRARTAAWRAANPEKVRAAHIAWRAANPEKVRAARAERVAWRAANPEKVRAREIAYRAANPDVYVRTDLKRHNGITDPPKELVEAIVTHRRLKRLLKEIQDA